jgi:hypothetical protein
MFSATISAYSSSRMCFFIPVGGIPKLGELADRRSVVAELFGHGAAGRQARGTRGRGILNFGASLECS